MVCRVKIFICADFCKSVDIYGYVWLYMGIYGYIWVCMVIYGYIWVCMVIYVYIYGYVWLVVRVGWILGSMLQLVVILIKCRSYFSHGGKNFFEGIT